MIEDILELIQTIREYEDDSEIINKLEEWVAVYMEEETGIKNTGWHYEGEDE